MQMAGWETMGVMVLCAELMLLIIRASQLQTIVKPENQRTASERTLIQRGLTRSVTLEAMLFVPASVLLVFITVRPFLMMLTPIRAVTAASPDVNMAFYGALGLSSYGFPFGLFKKIVSRIALVSLKEFATIVNSGANSV
jgi:hypothetical protein